MTDRVPVVDPSGPAHANPRISVIIPVYNVADYVERCLASLVGQTLVAPFELVVVDDGSTDATPNLVRGFAARHPERIRVFSKENGGHGSACNVGVTEARGAYLAFVDGDDFLEPTVLGEMLDEAERSGADIVIGNLRSHYADHTEIYKPLPECRGSASLTPAERTALFKSWSTPCGRLYRRALLADPELKMLEGISFDDVNFVPKTYVTASRIAYVDREWYEYERRRPGQSMQAVSPSILHIVPAIEELLAFCCQRGLFEKYRYELEYYTLSYVFTWTQRVEGVRDTPWREALLRMYRVADENFPDWPRSQAFRDVRPRLSGRAKILAARATGFRVLAARVLLRRGLGLLGRGVRA